MNHPVETYALRLEAGGRSITYSGDTGLTPALSDLACGTDVLLAEASFVDGQDNPQDLHLTGVQAGAAAAAAEARRLVVTHIPPWNSRDRAVAEARTTFEGPIDAATPGLVLDL
jgi:ribonuclease BN (tRNA processing enzyme)